MRKLYLVLFGVVLVMLAIGCNNCDITQADVDRAKAEARESGIRIGIRKAQMDHAKGFIGNTWKPTLGVVIVGFIIVIGIGLLWIVFRSKSKRLYEWWRLNRYEKNVRRDTLKLIAARKVDRPIDGMILEDLERVKTELEETTKQLIEVELHKVKHEGDIEAAKQLMNAKEKITKAQSLVTEVGLTIGYEGELLRINVIEKLIERIKGDADMPVATRLALLDYLTT